MSSVNSNFSFDLPDAGKTVKATGKPLDIQVAKNTTPPGEIFTGAKSTGANTDQKITAGFKNIELFTNGPKGSDSLARGLTKALFERFPPNQTT